jgi:thiaminase
VLLVYADLEAITKHETTRQYVHWLKAVATGEDYAAQIATLYVVEAVYLEAWSGVREAGAAGRDQSHPSH